MRALETTWRGYRFRSRAEARWAVLFTAADVAFEYERQGFELPSGWYLPDFWLPAQKAWLEVKGQEPTEREVGLLTELAAFTRQDVLLVVGAPDPDNLDQVELFDADGPSGVIDLRLPLSAYHAARADRFDGSSPPRKPVKPPRYW